MTSELLWIRRFSLLIFMIRLLILLSSRDETHLHSIPYRVNIWVKDNILVAFTFTWTRAIYQNKAKALLLPCSWSLGCMLVGSIVLGNTFWVKAMNSHSLSPCKSHCSPELGPCSTKSICSTARDTLYEGHGLRSNNRATWLICVKSTSNLHVRLNWIGFPLIFKSSLITTPPKSRLGTHGIGLNQMWMRWWCSPEAHTWE